ncbi:MAG: hypothetical protein KGZ39_05660 [Simkania sp.]|nr:hypothetical protein [Simkania sp.]
MGYLAFEEVTEKFRVTKDGPEAEVSFYAPFNEAIAYATLAVGGFRVVDGVMVAFEPEIYARPGVRLFALAVDVQEAGDYTCQAVEHPPSRGEGDFKTAFVTVSFGKFSVSSGEIDFDLSAEHLKLPLDKSDTIDEFFSTAPNPANNDNATNRQPFTDEAIYKVIPKASISISLNYRSFPDPSVWSCAVGKVNQYAWNGFSPGTLLFNGMRTRWAVTTNGGTANEQVFNFQCNYNGWNNRYSISAGKFVPYRIRHGGGISKPVYIPIDFNARVMQQNPYWISHTPPTCPD